MIMGLWDWLRPERKQARREARLHEVGQLTDQTVLADIARSDEDVIVRAVAISSLEDQALLAYLVACHHGKVRVALHASPRDQDYRDPAGGNGLPIRGVREGDVVPPVTLDPASAPIPALTLTLDPATLGLSARTGRSWRERTSDLLDRFGPGALAWLEALLIAADRRASRLKSPDPALERSEPAR